MENILSLPHRLRGRGFFAYLRRAAEVRRQRRALLDLNDRLLKDIGLSEHEARTEAERPIWDVPRHWRR